MTTDQFYFFSFSFLGHFGPFFVNFGLFFILGHFCIFGWSGELQGGVKRGLPDPQRALLSTLEVLYGTKFDSKHHVMDHMANVYEVQGVSKKTEF